MLTDDMRSLEEYNAFYGELAHILDRLVTRPKLVDDGTFLISLDIVGDRLMEINVMSPGGLIGAEILEKQHFASVLIDAVDDKVSYVQKYKRRVSNLEIATL